MEKKLIVLDLDGTTLQSDQTIAAETKATLQQARQAGHQVMIATGRPYRLSQKFYQELALDTPMVTFNGAVYHHPLQPFFQDAYYQTIDLSVARRIVTTFDSKTVRNVASELTDGVLIREKNQFVPNEMYETGENIKVGNILDGLTTNPTSLLLFAPEQELPEIQAIIDTEFKQDVSYNFWGAAFPAIEIMSQGFHKALGVQAAAKTLGFKREQIIAFGDERNDLEMLEYAGIGVAMGNGHEKAKAAADFITTSNDEQGITRFLEEHIAM